MKKQIKTLLMAIALLASTTAIANTPINLQGVTKIDMTCQKIDKSICNGEFPRTPVQVPNVYLNQDTNTLLFEGPCYECTLELVIPGTDTVVYTYSIPDGDDTVQLPTNLSGQYELHIHRGNYCFFGEIVL